MLIEIVGETARGKDTVCRYLQGRGYKTVCSYADRAMRRGETNGKEHHFVSKQEADRLLAKRKDEICAYTEIGPHRYWTFPENLLDADLYIIDPNGVRYLKEKFPDIPVTVIYVTCPDALADQRAKGRGDDRETFLKRQMDEKAQFQEFARKKDYDYIIHNTGTLQELYQQTDKIIQEAGL